MQEKCAMVTKVKQYAQQAKLSIREVERRCGFHYGIIQRWDEHLPSIDKVVKVAKVLGVTVDELVKDVDFRTTR